MDPTAAKPNRQQRRQTLKTVKTVKTAAQDKVAVRRASRLADNLGVGRTPHAPPIPLQNLNTDGSNDSASDEPGSFNWFNALPQQDADPTDVGSYRQKPDIAPTDRTPPETGKKWKDTDEIVEGLCTIYGVMAIPLMQIEPYDGAVLVGNAQLSAMSLEKVSRHHKTMRKVLKRIAVGNDYITLVMAHAGIAVAIAAHHGVINPRFNEPFVQTYIPEKDPSWTEQPGSSSRSPSTSAGGSAFSMNGSPNSSGTSSMRSPSPAEMQEVYRAAEQMTREAAVTRPGLQNLPAAMASYDPSDVLMRPDQNPASNLATQVRRDG